MSKSGLLSAFLGALFVAGLAIAPAHAQATRTWISGVGDDVNPCSRTAPCKTWAGAIVKTVAGGEIDSLDPAGFGTLTITKSITLDGGGGQVASALAAGTPGMTINAATNDVITIRNIRFQGALGNGTSPGTAGTNGIQIFQANQVEIQNCFISGFAQFGVTATPSANVSIKIQNTTISNNNGGIGTKPTGGALVKLVLDGSNVDENGGGIKFDGTGGGGTNAALTNSSVSLNTNNAVNAVSGASGAVNVDITHLVLANNGGTAVTSNNGAGGTSAVTVGRSILSNNGTAWANPTGTATLLSFKNNQVTGPVGIVPGTANFQ